MRTVVLVDGEHYPPVTRGAVAVARKAGHEVIGAAFLGGKEKLKGDPILEDVELEVGASLVSSLRGAIERFAPEVILDLSDAPVLGSADRMMLASITLSEGIAYQGQGFRLDPPTLPKLTSRRTVSVIGSGKRTGKTAVCAELAREARRRGSVPLIVAMGRGGPAEPVVTRGAEEPLSVEALLALAEAGQHASTDAYEDAIVARCTTVGARRGGAGLNGDPYTHTVHDAITAAEGEPHDIIFLEGSGTAIPPAAADATVFVIGSGTSDADLYSGLCDLRFVQADAIVLTGTDAPGADPDARIADLQARYSRLELSIPPMVRTVFELEPLDPIDGASVVLATTAPRWAADRMAERIESLGAKCVGITHSLSDRQALRADLDSFGGAPDMLLTEVKAAGIDVAASVARARGWRVVLCDNVPVGADGATRLEGIADTIL